jgi:DNA modification methylase
MTQQLRPDPKNARLHPDANKAMIRQSLEEVGPFRSIAVDGEGIVRAGNGVFEQAQALGLKVRIVEAGRDELIAVQRADLVGADAERAALLDNRAGETSAWDVDVLQALEAERPEVIDGLWSSADWADLTAPAAGSGNKHVTEAGAARLDALEKLMEKYGVELGQLWRLGDSFTFCGDLTDFDNVDRLLKGAKADVVFTDPPYGVNVSGAGGRALAGDLTFTAIPFAFDVFGAYLADGGWVYVCGGQSNFALYTKLFEKHFRQLPRVIIWDKGQFVLRHSGYHSQFELIYYGFTPGGSKRWFGSRAGEAASDVWTVQRPGNDRMHLTEKPVELARRAIENTCPPGGLVFDPFAGSHSTMAACIELGRRFFGGDLAPEYVAAGIERWVEMTGDQPELAETFPVKVTGAELVGPDLEGQP